MTTTLTDQGEKKSLFSKKPKGDAAAEPELPDFSEFSAVKPTPNLAPRYVRDRRAADKTMRISFWAIILVVALLVGVVIASMFHALNKQADLDDAVNTQAQVTNEVTRLQPVSDYYDGLVQRQELATSTMQNDIDYSALVAGLFKAAAGNVTVTSATFAPTAPCPGPSPFTPPEGMGCINVSVEADSPRSAAAFVESLNADTELFSGAFIPTFSFGGDAPNAVTVNYGANALSMRFVPADRQAEVRAAAESAALGAPAVPTTPAPTGATP